MLSDSYSCRMLFFYFIDIGLLEELVQVDIVNLDDLLDVLDDSPSEIVHVLEIVLVEDALELLVANLVVTGDIDRSEQLLGVLRLDGRVKHLHQLMKLVLVEFSGIAAIKNREGKMRLVGF